MSGPIIFFLLVWGGISGVALVLARDRLSAEDHEPHRRLIWDEILVRGIAVTGVTFAVGMFSLILIPSLTLPVSRWLALIVWAFSVWPLLIPTRRFLPMVPYLSAHAAVLLSMALTVLSAVMLGIYTLIRLLALHPEFL